MKVLPFYIIFTSLLLTQKPALSYEWSERQAFCTDYAKQKIKNNSYSHYEFQVAHNNCMRNADKLINEYKNQQLLIQQQRVRRNRELQNHRIRKEQERIRKEQERVKKAKQEEKRLEELTNNLHNIFR